jgi:hypothetical protein
MTEILQSFLSTFFFAGKFSFDFVVIFYVALQVRLFVVDLVKPFASITMLYRAREYHSSTIITSGQGTVR